MKVMMNMFTGIKKIVLVKTQEELSLMNGTNGQRAQMETYTFHTPLQAMFVSRPSSD